MFQRKDMVRIKMSFITVLMFALECSILVFADDRNNAYERAVEIKTQYEEAINKSNLKLAEKYFQKGVSNLLSTKMDSAANTLLIEFYQLKYRLLDKQDADIDDILEVATEVFRTEDVQNSNPDIYGVLCTDIGGMYNYKKNRITSIRFYEKAAEVFKQSPTAPPKVLGLAYNNLAYAYVEIGYMHQVIKNYERAHKLWIESTPEDIIYNSTALSNLIDAYLEYGETKTASQYLQVFSEYFSKYVNTQNLYLEYLNQNDSILKATYSYLKSEINVAMHQNDFVLAQDKIKQLEKLFQHTPETVKETFKIYLFSSIEKLGLAYKNEKRFSESKKAYWDSKKYITDTFRKMKYHANMGILYYDQKFYKKSLEEINQALNLFSDGSKSISFFMLTVLKAELLAELGEKESSLQELNLLYIRMLDIDKSHWNTGQLTYKDFNKLNSHRHLAILLKSAKTHEILYEKDGDNTHTRLAGNFYTIAAEMFQKYYQKGFYNANLNKYSREIKDGLLKTAVSNPKTELSDLINSLENNESQHLWRKFLDRNYASLGLSEEWMKEQQLEALKDEYLADLDSVLAENALIKLQKNFSDNENMTSASFRKFSTADVDVKHIQRKLKPGEVLLRFIVGDKNVFAFIIRDQSVRLIHLGDTEELKQSVLEYYQQLSTISNEYKNIGAKLYEQLVAPLQIEQEKYLTFILEDFFQMLPMESLLWYGAHSSVRSVSYAYSLKMLEIQSQIQNQGRNKQVAVFAPKYSGDNSEIRASGRNNWSPLFFAEKEANAVLSTTKGKLFAGELATAENFKQASGSYNILHLAMHAVMDTADYEQSFLVFQNQQPLYFNELYQMDIPSQLVVLSACNTGKGPLENGEGFMSLSKAFTYAGVNATIHSLWEVPDKETAHLMEIFYELLKEGTEMSEALYRAKQEFIQRYPQKSHPYFWAGFVLNGKVSSEAPKSHLPVSAILFLIIPGGLLALGIYRHTLRKENRKNLN